ncbi:MAG: hypothetical protein NVSMB17_05490 [Candidatus Dormibacteria bacterium]
MLLIFGIAAVFLVGTVALALDYGLAATHQRAVQGAADQAALAGANQLGASPSAADYTNARTTAFIYLRDNLLPGLTVGQLSGPNCDLTIKLDHCALPSPYTQYSVSIQSPARTPDGQPVPSPGQTVSVEVFESVTAALGAILGQGTVAISARSIAEALKPVYSSYALYTDGCLDIGNHLELVGGDVYVNQCTLNFLSQNQASFCSYATPRQAGNLTFGPQANAPGITKLGNQTLAACQAGAADAILTVGNITTSPVTIPPPAFAPPPQVPTCPGGVCVPAQINQPCTNGTVDSSGSSVGARCYGPGAYSSIGAGAAGSSTAPIANNLNPGLYVINGENGCTDPCPSVVFGGNTMNGNFSDVKDQCWASPNNPGQGSWIAPCPDGFVSNPQVPVDPRCAGSAITPVLPPAFTATAGSSGASPGLSTGTYYVRITAKNALGESTSNEVSVAIPVGVNGQGSIDLTIPYQAGVVSYEVYGPSTTPGGEVKAPMTLAQPVPAAPPPPPAPAPPPPGPVTARLTALQSGSTPFPIFNNSGCAAGFHNLPRNPYENFGVTFILNGRASVCLTAGCVDPPAAGPRPVVMLSPYCSTLSTDGTLPARPPCPYARNGPNINDGAFTFTGTSQGMIQALGSGTELNLTGTLSAPSMALKVGSDRGGGFAKFHVIPGQVIVKSAAVYSGNTLDPLVYYGPNGAALPGYVRLVQ